MEKIKNTIFSEQGMKIVNALFFLSLFFRNSGIIFISYIVWIAYLIYGIRTTSSRTVKIVYVVLFIFATAMILINLVSLVRS